MEESTSRKKTRLTPREREVIDLFLKGGVDQAIAEKLDISPKTVHTTINRIHSKIRKVYQEDEERGGDLPTGKEQQGGSIPPKERALRFANDEAFLKGVTHLWRKQPFELGGWHCLIVPDNVANDLLANFTGEEVKEIELVNLADLPEQEALRRYAARFKK
jgi:Bacterial regulatory proteins, luxR family